MTLAPVPSYSFPESAVAALSRVTSYSEWRRRPQGSIPTFGDIRRDAVRQWLDDMLARTGEGWLTPEQAQQLLELVGIATAAIRRVTTLDEAIAAGHAIGYPVALKAVGPEIVHKTDIGGVVLDIADETALGDAHEIVRSRVGDAMTAAVVQQMVQGGVELLVGAFVDPTFGPLVACGSGGVLVDLLQDTTFRIHPLTDLDAAEMLDDLKAVRLLRGYRGSPPADERAVVDVLLRVSALLEICPEIQELDVNPLKVLTRGARAVDVRIRVGRATLPPPSRRVSY
jgi:acyl-CoA synthetase (NDP forming)